MDYSILDFGAIADGQSLNTIALQKAIDHCHQQHGGRVVFKPGTYRSGTLYLRSNVSLHFEEGSVLLGSSDLDDYPLPDAHFTDAVGHVRGRALVIADHVENGGFSGNGKIDGAGKTFSTDDLRFQERPFLVRFVHSKNIDIKNVSLVNSAAWTVHLMGCENVDVRDITIHSRCNENNDGIDIDSCKNVTISHCDITTDDDAICLKSTIAQTCEQIEVSHCTLWSNCGAIKLGTESYGDMRDVHIHHCHVRFAGIGALKIISMDGAIVENINIHDVGVDATTGPIFIRLGDRGRCYDPQDARKPVGALRNVRFSQIKANVKIPDHPMLNYWTKEMVPAMASSCVFITGLEGAYVEDLELVDCEFSLYGGGAIADRDHMPDEQSNLYPELHHFGILPASCVYIRHARSVKFENVNCELQNPDERDVIVSSDVENLVLENCKWPIRQVS